MLSARFDKPPLVSIGIPTFNRARLLHTAIENAREQTYSNLEIIISDNASTDPEVESLCRRAEQEDTRIKYFRQPHNIGPTANFEFTLLNSSGKFFAWFADDDLHTPTYVEKLLHAYSGASRQTALICFEAQYITEVGAFTFFPEAEAFYGGLRGEAVERMSTTIRCGPGNIIYGLFRREALFHNNAPITRWIGPTLNELPFFALVAFAGEILCLPEIGLWKRAPLKVCQAARWERAGGLNPNGPGLNIPGLIKYHWRVLKELDQVFNVIDVPERDRRILRQDTMRGLAKHALACIAGWKPARKAGIAAPT